MCLEECECLPWRRVFFYSLSWLSGKQSGLGDEAEQGKSARYGSYRSRCSHMRRAKQNSADAQSEGSWIQENSVAQHARRVEEGLLCLCIRHLNVCVRPALMADASSRWRCWEEGRGCRSVCRRSWLSCSQTRCALELGHALPLWRPVV